MAKVIQAILNLQDNMSRGLLAAARNTQGVTREMRTATREVVNFKNKASAAVTDAAKKVAALGVAAVGAFAAFSVKTGMDFEAQMSKVQAISGATATEVEALTAKAKEMGATTKFSATESAQALEYMAMAGWKTDQMIGGLPGIMNLAAASGEDLAEVSDIVTDALTAFGLKASDSAHFADVLAKASSSSNTNVSLMGNTFQYVAPVAGALGYSIEDTAVAIGLMANAGIKGEKAGTALRGALTNLAKPSDTVAAYMDALNVSLTDAQGNVKPLSALMVDLRQKFAGLTDAQKAEYAAGIAGKEAMSGLLAIVNASDADFNNLTQAIANSDGTAQSMAQTMQDNLKGQLEQLGGAVETVGLTFYDAIKGKATDAITSIADKISAWQSDGSIDAVAEKVGVVFGNAVDKASSALTWLSQNGDTVIGVLKALGIAFAGVKVLEFAGNVARAVNDLSLFTQTVIAVSGPMRTHAVTLATSSAAWVKNTAMMAANKIGMAASAVATGAVTAATTAATAAQWALNAAFVATPIGWIVLGLGALVAAGVALYQNWDTVKAKASELWVKATEVFTGIKDSIVGAFDAAKEKVSGFFSWLDDKISSVPVIGNIYEGGKGVISWIGDKLAGNALGTSYWRGGLTRVNERGGEIINLPSGTQIIPHDVSTRMVQGGGVTVNVTVMGNMIGNEQYADEMGEIIVGKILAAHGNM
ncbi:MAG: phage tail tape measure protein [Butyricicoccus pullicaecorum]|nr:phage tail tape measure protein [Butyricicoccus pullicaecorum]